MHCDVTVPGLLSAPPELRLPALELLLARGRAAHDARQTLEQWLGEAFGLGARPLPAGALTALADGGSPGEASWLRADPVHLRLERDRLVLIPSAAFAVAREEAESLCEALNRQCSATMTLYPLHPERWCARLTADLALESPSSLEAAGRDVDSILPKGDARWHALLNETQMLLHAHPVNAAREARGEPAVNSLWPWGAGRLPASAGAPWHSVCADEPLALGLARLAGLRHRPLPAGANEWLERAPPDGRYLVMLDALRAPLALGDAEACAQRLQSLEERWFAPLLAALRSGRIGMATIRVPDAGFSAETIRGDLRRFWHRPKAIARYL